MDWQAFTNGFMRSFRLTSALTIGLCLCVPLVALLGVAWALEWTAERGLDVATRIFDACYQDGR